MVIIFTCYMSCSSTEDLTFGKIREEIREKIREVDKVLTSHITNCNHLNDYIVKCY